jgi:hypothetical protein
MAGLLDGVVLNCATTGTGTLTLGAAVAPYLGMAAAGAVSGNTYSYSIIDGTANSEYGTGVWTSGGVNGTLTRGPIWSTNSNAAISCSGSQLVRISALMEDLIPSAQLGPEFVMLNGKLVASVAANNLTIAVKTKAGNDPSAGDPVLFVFRNATNATGDYTVIKQTVALSFTINSGSTLGTANGVPFRLWVVVLNNGGTVVLGAINCVAGGASPTQIGPLSEDVLQNTGAPTNGGNNALQIYESHGNLAAVPIRILGYLEWSSGLTTAGTWASGPTKIQLFSPGIKKPGDVVQTVWATDTLAFTTTSSTFQTTNTSLSISPVSAANLVAVRAMGTLSLPGNSGALLAFTQLFRGSTAVGSITIAINNSSQGPYCPDALEAFDAPGSTSAQTYAVKIKNSDNASAVGWNNFAGRIGTIRGDEIMA